MRRWLAIAGVSLAVTSAAWAQHGSGGHGGGGFSGGGHASGGSSGGSHISGGSSSGRSSSGSHGNSVAGPMRPMPRYGGAGPVHTGVSRPGSSHAPLNSHYGASRTGTASSHAASIHNGGYGSGNHGGGNNHGGWNRGGSRGRGIRLYAYSGGWWLGPWQFYPFLDADLSWDYWHDTGDDGDAIAMASTGADMVEDAPPQGGGADNGYADGEDPDPPLHGTATQLEGGVPSLTLVYRSGQTEQVANYVVSNSGVTVVDASGVRSVPVADLNVAGTIQANAQSGMQLPSSWQ